MLREHGADDLIEHGRLVAAGRAEPLPRLLVMIDEFATLAAELPDFIASLVGIAQRGRSLGVHLLLATQRPSGAVNENIRANTNLRICLRVQTAQDSNDVIDSPAAAGIGRGQPGRAYVRLGPSELHPIQTALVTRLGAGPRPAPVECAGSRSRRTAAAAAGGRPDRRLSGGPRPRRLVAAAREAAAERAHRRAVPGCRRCRRRSALEDLLELRAAAPVRRRAGAAWSARRWSTTRAPRPSTRLGWNLDAGNLLLFGIGGSGTTTALQTLATVAGRARRSRRAAHLRAGLRRRRAAGAASACPTSAR